MSTSQGFSGVGLMKFHARTATGGQGIGRMIGNSSKVSIKFDPKTVERNSSMDVNRSPLRRMTQATAATITVVTDEFSKKNHAMATRSRIDEVAEDQATTITETLPAGAVVGDILAVSKRNINSLVVTDSTVGSPKTLQLGINYTVDLFSGDITLLDITTGGAFLQPFKAAFKQGAVTMLAGLTVPDTEIWVSLNGTNTDTGQKGVFDAYRCRFDPTDVWELINNDYNDTTLVGSILQDLTKLPSAIGGQYFNFAVPSTIA